MDRLGRAIKNTFALTVAEMFSRMVGFVFAAVLARQLSPNEFGEYTTILALIGLFGPLADFGISQILVREIAVNRARASILVCNALVITVGLASVAWLLLIVIAFAVNYPVALRPYIILAGLGVVGNTITLTLGAVLRGYERMEILALATSALVLISSSIGIAAALAGYGLAIQIGINIIAACASACFLLLIVHEKFAPLAWTFDVLLYRTLVREALPVALLVAMAVLLTWMDVLILGQVNSMEQVAMYNAATRVIDVAQIVNLSAGAAMFPAIAASWRESAEAARELYSQSLRFFVALSLAVTVGITVLADPLAIAIFGVAYADVATPLRWLGWTFFFTTVNGPMGPLLVAAGDRYRKFVPAIALAVVGNLVLNLVLAPHWGAVGAASAFAVTGVATFIIRQRVAVEYFQTPPRLEAFLARPTLAALVMGLGVWVLQSINIFVATGAGVVIFVGMLGLLGELKREPYRTVWLVILSVALRKRINE